MAKNTDKSSNLGMGVVFMLMGLAWLFSMGGLNFENVALQNWWAFGTLLPVFYLGQAAMTARQEGKATMGYFGGAFGALAALLAFLNIISWGVVGAVAMVGIGIGFILDSRS